MTPAPGDRDLGREIATPAPGSFEARVASRLLRNDVSDVVVRTNPNPTPTLMSWCACGLALTLTLPLALTLTLAQTLTLTRCAYGPALR